MLSRSRTVATKAPPPASTADGDEAPLAEDKIPAAAAAIEAARRITANHRLRAFGSGTGTSSPTDSDGRQSLRPHHYYVRPGPHGTVITVTDKRTKQASPPVEWLTPFPMDGIQPVHVRDDDSPWHVIPHWALVDGRAMLVGLDIRCFIEEHDRDGQPLPRRPVGEQLIDLTQQVLRGISLSAVRAESQAYISDQFAGFADALPPSPLSDHARTIATALTAKGQPRKRRIPAQDDLLARVAQLYNTALSSGSATPVRYVEERLREEGVQISTRGGRDQVRKWVQRARQRGLLAPPSKR